MITSSRPWVINKSLVSPFLIFPLLLTPLITLFFLNVSHPGLVLLPLLSPGSNLTYLIAPSMSVSMAQFHLFINFSMVCLKALYLVLFSSSCILLLLALSFPIHLQIITSMQMTLNFSYLSQQPHILIILLSWKLQFQVFPIGCPAIFSHLILPKLSFLSSVFLNNSQNSTLLPFVYQIMSLSHLLTLLEILVSSLIKIFLMLNISLPSLNHAFSILKISGAYEIWLIALLLQLLLLLSFTPRSTTATLFCLIFQLLKLIAFNLFLILLPVPSLELQNFIISLLFSNLFTGLQWTREFITKFSLSLTNLSKLVILPIFALFSRSHHIVLHAPHLLSHSIVLLSLLV